MEPIRKQKYIILAVILIYLLTGCNQLFNPQNSKNGDSVNQPNEQGDTAASPMPIDPYEQAKEADITLYYKHEIADYLVSERRTVLQEKEAIEQVIVEELLKGPQNFERRMVMPPGTKVIDVTRRGDTVFVNLTSDFLNPIDLGSIPGKEDTPEEERSKVQAEMKRLSVYSIVNSLTYLDGVNQVKLMVNNTQLSYREMGTELLIDEGSTLGPESPMMAIRRNKGFNLSPARTVRFLMGALLGEPNWDIVYLFLSNKTMDGSTLPPLDEFKAKIPPVVGGMIEFEGNPVQDEEFLKDKAFVTVTYGNKVSGTRKDVREVLTVDEIEGIWKVRLPEFFSQYR